MKAVELYISMVLFIMLYLVILTFEIQCDHSNESYQAERSLGAVYSAMEMQGGLKHLSL